MYSVKREGDYFLPGIRLDTCAILFLAVGALEESVTQANRRKSQGRSHRGRLFYFWGGFGGLMLSPLGMTENSSGRGCFVVHSKIARSLTWLP